MFAIVFLDERFIGAGPGTVIELTDQAPFAALARYADRDGAHSERLRVWRATPDLKVGDRVVMHEPTSVVWT